MADLARRFRQLVLLFCVISLRPSEAVSSWNTGVSNVLLQGGGSSGRPFIAASSTATGRVLRVKSMEQSVVDGLPGTFVEPTTPATEFKCRYTHESNPSMYLQTDGTFVDRSTVNCQLPDWGRTYPAATVKFALYAGELLIEAFGPDLTIYMAETVFRVLPSAILSGSTDVVVSGAGFSTDASQRQYYCVIFPLAGELRWRASSRGMYPKFARKFPFTPINNTMGSCTVDWPYPAAETRLTLIHESAPAKILFDRLSSADRALLGSLTAFAQPLIESLSSDSTLTWAALPVTTKEEWFAISDTVGHYAGGAQGTKLIVSGHGFKNAVNYPAGHGAFSDGPYQCVFTSDDGSYEATSVAVATMEGSAYSSTRLECLTPAWAPSQGLSRFTVRTSSGETLAETAGYVHAFSFLEVPTWTANTPPEGLIVFDGVHCSSHIHEFGAYDGRAPLRLSLDYTAMRPKAAEAFVQRLEDEAPALNSVLRRTVAQPKADFSQVVATDMLLPGGTYRMGNASHTLELPHAQGALPARLTRPEMRWNGDEAVWESVASALGVRDNVPAPSHLVFETVSDDNHTVKGVLTWNVSRGWEGYAYRLCVTVRHVPAAAEDSSFRLFNRRCVYVIVPKCLRCYTPQDTLDAIARQYSASWLDLWSVNPSLINTTRVDLSRDEVFNTAKDQTYLKVPDRRAIRLGVTYQMGTRDQLVNVAQRFGMLIADLQALNPDVVASNQDADMRGKMMCILPNTAQYTSCEKQEEPANALHFEALYRAPFFYDYDVTGAPLKAHNPRYPQPPLQQPALVPEGSASGKP